MEQKYVVFKKDDFAMVVDAVLSGEDPESVEGSLTQLELTDLFVIRFQDVLAGPGLHAYAGAAQTMIQGMRMIEPIEGTGDRVKALERVRDAAFEAANAADEYPNKKVPD